MPASYEEFEDLYRDLTGGMTGFEGFMEAYEQTGFTDPDMSTNEDLGGFHMFLYAFYPETGLSQEEWEERREEWFDYSDTDFLDWDAIREALEEISPPQ